MTLNKAGKAGAEVPNPYFTILLSVHQNSTLDVDFLARKLFSDENSGGNSV